MTQLHSTRGPGRLYNFSSYSKSLKFSKCVHIKIQLNCLISCRLRGSSNEVGNISIHINFTKKKKMIRTILGFFNFQRFFSSNYGKSNGTWKCVMPSTRCSFNKRNKKMPFKSKAQYRNKHFSGWDNQKYVTFLVWITKNASYCSYNYHLIYRIIILKWLDKQ